MRWEVRETVPKASGIWKMRRLICQVGSGSIQTSYLLFFVFWGAFSYVKILKPELRLEEHKYKNKWIVCYLTRLHFLPSFSFLFFGQPGGFVSAFLSLTVRHGHSHCRQYCSVEASIPVHVQCQMVDDMPPRHSLSSSFGEFLILGFHVLLAAFAQTSKVFIADKCTLPIFAIWMVKCFVDGYLFE